MTRTSPRSAPRQQGRVHHLRRRDLIRPEIAMNQASYRAEAKKLFDAYITTWGLDGQDIDVERTLTPDQLRRVRRHNSPG